MKKIFNKRTVLALSGLAVITYLLFGITIIAQDEQGVVVTFGKAENKRTVTAR